MTRITVTVADDVANEINELAAKENRKLASMAALLLVKGLKERTRKKADKPKEGDE